MVGLLCTTSAPVWAQASGISGVVRDSSGGALPGVTVEASSPALIEKVRTVVTDGDGRYTIDALGLGTYAVSFSLPGFRTLRREGVTLTTGFTATVNADLEVGGLEETITVSGAAPLVDVQNARQQRVMSATLLSTLPTGQTSIVSLITLTPGMTGNATVGGSTGAYHSGQTKGTFHGKRGSKIKFDGMRIDNYAGAGDSPGYLYNVQTIEETVIETGGSGADSDTPNVSMNLIPKEGSNSFRGTANGLFTNHSLQSDNLTTDLIARGLQSVPEVDRMYDAGFTLGGPIKQDKVWFYAAIRRWGTRNQAANLFWNATQGTPFYTPDLNRPAFRDEKYSSHALRITTQLSPRNKLQVFADIKNDCICETGGAGSALGSGATNSREGVATWNLWPNGIVQGTWTNTVTSKLLLDAGASVVMFHWPGDLPAGVSPNDVSILEQSTNFIYNSPGGFYNPDRRLGDRYAERFGASYVTGSHVFKAGVTIDHGYSDTINIGTGLSVAPGISYIFNRGLPVSVRYDALPRHETYYQRAEMGVFAQDQWRYKRLTLNVGARFEYYKGYIPPVDREAGPFVPAAHFDETVNAPLWKDLNPRLGAAYDLSGDGRTAIKTSFGRYVSMTGNTAVSVYHPLNRTVNNTTRPWNDTNGNFFPDCVLTDFAVNGECGGLVNTNFGQVNPNAIVYADDVRNGWFRRPYTWDFGSEIQHQLSSQLSVTAGYYHNSDGGFAVTDNVSTTPGDYSTFTITAPRDPRLPGGGGYPVTGTDVNPNKFGIVNNVITQSSNFGKRTRVNDFVGLTIDLRMGNGIRVGGGVDAGRTADDACFDIDAAMTPTLLTGTNTLVATPSTRSVVNGQNLCRNVEGLSDTAQIKLNGSYPLPAGFVVAATFQNLPGIPWLATYNATTAEVAPSLGRPLSGGVRTTPVALLAPNQMREPRRTQIDLRLAKDVRVGGARRLTMNFDLYNLLNASTVLGLNTTFGANWLVPQQILNGRLLQFSAGLTF